MRVNDSEVHNQNQEAAPQVKAGVSPAVKGFAWFIGISFAFMLTMALMFLSVFMDTSDFKNRNKY